jgi:hypothetical protein
VWRYTWDPDKRKWDKPPSDAKTGGAASSTDPATWTAFENALEVYLRDGWDGVGFVPLPGDNLTFVDADRCRNPTTGAVEKWAGDVTRQLNTYTEVSVSGQGLHPILFGRKPDRKRTRRGRLEIYDGSTASDKPGGRYLCVTGHLFDGCPAEVCERQKELTAVYEKYLKSGAVHPSQLSDDDLKKVMFRWKNGGVIKALWDGEDLQYPSTSEADLAFCNHLGWWTDWERERTNRMFCDSKRWREKWDAVHGEQTYGDMTLDKAFEGKKPGMGYTGSNPPGSAEKKPPRAAVEWELPPRLGQDFPVPEFPLECLPAWLGCWSASLADALQVPADLLVMLALSFAGAGVAGKYRLSVRPGWVEPLNVFTVAALAVGERKSAAFRNTLAPVVAAEKAEQTRMAPVIAKAASAQRVLSGRLKIAEAKAAKETRVAERLTLMDEANKLAVELARHVVPSDPRFFCDDITPEKLSGLIAQHGGRMLQAGPEGTAFEIAKGRYSEEPNFDVYLKGHAGDPLRVDRVGREPETVENPVLSCALAVQPDVIAGMAGKTSIMSARGWLARWLYSIPRAMVGRRTPGQPAAAPDVLQTYHKNMLALWELTEGKDQDGKPTAHWLTFGAEADQRMLEFERWLEPQLAPDGELSWMYGWANKLAGTAARLAGILHLAADPTPPVASRIEDSAAEAAIQLARDYLLPHAQAAFGCMGADAVMEGAAKVWAAVVRHSPNFESNADGSQRVTRRDIHQWERRTFPSPDDLDPVLRLMVEWGYLRPWSDPDSKPGVGRPSPTFEVNPLALARDRPPAERTQ